MADAQDTANAQARHRLSLHNGPRAGSFASRLSALGKLLQRPHRIVVLKPKFIFAASRNPEMLENSRFLLDFEIAV